MFWVSIHSVPSCSTIPHGPPGIAVRLDHLVRRRIDLEELVAVERRDPDTTPRLGEEARTPVHGDLGQDPFVELGRRGCGDRR